MKITGRLCVLASLVLGLVPDGLAADESAVVIGPYLQNLTSDGVVVRWVTADPDNPSEFVYHRAPITGGKPDTEYEFATGENGRFKGVFRTAPVEPAAFRFVAYGDTRTQAEVHARLIDRIVDEKPAFVVHTGDLVGNGRRANLWLREFFGPATQLISKVVLFPVLGNHEENSPLYFNLFELPGNERFYSFDYGQVHVVALDSNDPPFPEEHENEARWVEQYRRVRDEFWARQLEWLRGDLDRHQDAALTVVCLHSPLYSSTANEARQKNYKLMRTRLQLLFETHGVDGVFSGHDHNYQRHVVNGIQYVVTGGGGAPLYECGPVQPTEVARAKEHHYVVVSVRGKTANARVVTIDGTIADTFTVGATK